MPPAQSVFIPVDTALGQWIASIQASGATITDFTTGSGARTLGEAISIVVSNSSAIADQLQQDSYLDTATGDALTELGTANWGVARKPAVQATGEITITRQDPSGALLIPAGWSQLSTVPSVPGGTGVSIVTSEDAVFADTVGSASVTAQAVIGGLAGNLTAGIFLTPLAPVSGVSNQNGYEVTIAFTGGVDQESDDAYRARIPIDVQGRVLGKALSFQAAALGIPGVLSAGVLTAGSERGNGSFVPAGSVEVYYQGSASLLTAVQSAVDNAATANQNPEAFASVNLTSPRGQLRVVAALTAYVPAGIDPTATQTAILAALQAYVDGTGIGGTAYASVAAQTVLDVANVISVDLPFTTFNLFGDSGATNITTPGDSYLNLAAGDATITVNTL